MKLNIGTLALALVGALLLARSAAGQPWTPWRIVGLAIALPAFLLFVLARIQLGRAFSVQARASTLVTTGIYARVRNPIYVFGGLTIAGLFIWGTPPLVAARLRAPHPDAVAPRTEGRACAGGQVRGCVPGIQAEDVVLKRRRHGQANGGMRDRTCRVRVVQGVRSGTERLA